MMAHPNQNVEPSQPTAVSQPAPIGNFADGWTRSQLETRFGLSNQALMWLPTAAFHFLFRR